MCSPPSSESVRDNFFPHLQNQTKIWHEILLIHAGSLQERLTRIASSFAIMALASILSTKPSAFFRLNHFYQSTSAESEDRSSATHTFGNRVWQIIYWSWMKQKIGGMVRDTQSDVVETNPRFLTFGKPTLSSGIFTNEQELYILNLSRLKNLLEDRSTFSFLGKIAHIQRIIVLLSLKPKSSFASCSILLLKKEIWNWVMYRFHFPSFPLRR